MGTIALFLIMAVVVTTRIVVAHLADPPASDEELQLTSRTIR